MSLRATGVVAFVAGDPVLRGVDLEVAAGSIVGLHGSNGSGKSTLLRVLAGDSASSAGCVWLSGVDVSSWPLHQRSRAGLGYVAQTASVIPGQTVRANVGLGEASPARVEQALADAGLQALAARRVGALSIGERRRVEIARALLRGGSALVLDEPFAGLDPAGRAWAHAAFRARALAGVAVLVADPDGERLADLAHVSVVLSAGRVSVPGHRHVSC